MSVPELLLNSLEEMTEENFKKFKFHLELNHVDGSKAFPKAQLEQADRQDTVNKIIQCYTTEGAVKATVTILRKLCMNELAENLLKAGKDGGPIIAPSDPGTWNITLNKN